MVFYLVANLFKAPLCKYLSKYTQPYTLRMLSSLNNKRGGWNKRGGGKKVAKSLNVEAGINVKGGIFWKN